MLELYDALEKRLKRHRPSDYITWMSKRLAESWSDPKKFVQIPPHRIIHSIEANCAYWKEGYAEPVEWNSVAKIMNTYNDCVDPFQSSTIHENLGRFFLMMHREQIELQRRASWAYIMRVWHLFVRTPSMQKTNMEFYSHFGLTIDHWIKISFLCWVIAVNESGNPFLIKSVPDHTSDIREDTFENFLKYSSRSPDEIGQYFREIRKVVPYELHSLIRSSFLETPIVRFADERMIVPHTHLLFRHSGEGLYRLAKDLSLFDDEFGDSFERYVKKVLESLHTHLSIIANKQIIKVVKSKSCDFLVELEDTVILVECKACSFSARHFSDEAIMKNNSTGKVAKGLTQLYASAKDLEQGLFDKFEVDKNKATIGIVVTFGEIPSANSDWYFEEFFLKRADDKLVRAIYPSRQMIRRPIVLDISALEKLVGLLNAQPKGLPDLYDERKSQGYAATGDWGIWLYDETLDKDTSELLTFLQRERVAFLDEIGFSPEAFPAWG